MLSGERAEADIATGNRTWAAALLEDVFHLGLCEGAAEGGFAVLDLGLDVGRYFGEDYALRVMEWIRARYVPAEVFGRPEDDRSVQVWRLVRGK